MKFVQTLLAGAVLTMAAVSAQAAVYNLGTVGSTLISKNVTVDVVGSFSDVFNFSIGKLTDLQGNSVGVAVKNKKGEAISYIQNGQVELFKGSTSLGSFSFNAEKSSTFTKLAAGDYSFKVTGFTAGKGVEDFSPSYTLSAVAVAPVPEPETYALMGLGLVGVLAARRRKARQVA